MCLLSRIFDSVVGNLAQNFAEGTEYFKVMKRNWVCTSIMIVNTSTRHVQQGHSKHLGTGLAENGPARLLAMAMFRVMGGLLPGQDNVTLAFTIV